MDPKKRDKIFRSIGNIFTEDRPTMSDKRKRRLQALAMAEDEKQFVRPEAKDLHKYYAHAFDPIPVLMQVFIRSHGKKAGLRILAIG